MSDSAKNARNVAIILAIAGAVFFIPGGGRAARTFEAALWTVFALGFGLIFLRMYREHRVALFSLGDVHRALLYFAVALGFFLWAVRTRLWYATELQHGTVLRIEQVHRWGGLGEVLWFALAGMAVYALVAMYRRWRAY